MASFFCQAPFLYGFLSKLIGNHLSLYFPSSTLRVNSAQHKLKAQDRPFDRLRTGSKTVLPLPRKIVDQSHIATFVERTGQGGGYLSNFGSLPESLRKLKSVLACWRTSSCLLTIVFLLRASAIKKQASDCVRLGVGCAYPLGGRSARDGSCLGG